MTSRSYSFPRSLTYRRKVQPVRSQTGSQHIRSGFRSRLGSFRPEPNRAKQLHFIVQKLIFETVAVCLFVCLFQKLKHKEVSGICSSIYTVILNHWNVFALWFPIISPARRKWKLWRSLLVNPGTTIGEKSFS